jgi:hypothetical protein
MSYPSYAEVLVEFFTKEAGGRKTPPFLDDKGYHIFGFLVILNI